MHLAVLGAGAVGSLLAGCLSLAGHHVWLVRRAGTPGPEDLVLVRPDRSRHTVAVDAVTAPEALPRELAGIVVAVKQADVGEVLASLAPRSDTPLVMVQNGIGAEELAASRRPGAPIVAASLTAATELGPMGEVRWLRRGGIALASVQGTTATLVAGLAAAFASAGLPSAVLPEAAAMKWSKLLANLVGNATSALLDMDPAAVYADPRTFGIERRQVLEAVDVMAGLGLRPVSLPGAHVRLLVTGLRLPEPLARPVVARAIGGARGGKSPSLRLHLRNGGTGPSEVVWLNGAVAEHAGQVGKDAPVNRALARLVEEAIADPRRAAWFRGRPDRLLAAVDAEQPTG